MTLDERASVDERRASQDRVFRTALGLSVLLHVVLFFLWRVVPIPPSPLSAAGPRAGDFYAAGGGMQAMNLLARREHLRRELEIKLMKRFGSGCEPEIVAVLDTLEEESLQSDARFTEAYIRQRSARGYGPERIRQELRQKGVADSLLEEAIATADIDWVALAREVRLKKFGAAAPDEFSEKARQLRFLNYRGFGGELAGGALGDYEEA